jgi:hypothetical protein
VVHVCNSSTQEAKAGGSQVQGQLRLHTKTLSKKYVSKENNTPLPLMNIHLKILDKIFANSIS